MAQQRWVFSHGNSGIYPFDVTQYDHHYSYLRASGSPNILGSLERLSPPPTFIQRRAEASWGDLEVTGTAGIFQATLNGERN